MKTFGETIRELREKNKLPLRKVAALLDIDQSFLSKIERNERKATKEQVIQLAKIFITDEKNLLIQFLSDKVTYEIVNEEFGFEALKVAEKKVKYLKSKTK
mgnify:CR=1 FL=1